jgi:sugar lactone lactonase YvrE/S-formylglutathione hydrolase FrmB
MHRILFSAVPVLLLSLSISEGQQVAPVDPNALVQKIQGELNGPRLPESSNNPAVPQGEFMQGVVNSAIYPGTAINFQVWVPAQYDPAKPACFLLVMDGIGGQEAVVNNLMAEKAMPVTIVIGISPGMAFQNVPGKLQRPMRYIRSFEFDSTHSYFPNFVLNELLPAVEQLKTQNGRAIHLSRDGNDHAVMGMSSGGIAAFGLAWQRPDQFRRVYSAIGTFVPMRGGNEYAPLIRKTESKPIRIFLEDGSVDAWSTDFGMWYDANLAMESALTFGNYDVAHAWGTHGHDGGPGTTILPDVLRWLWRDYPNPIVAGNSQNWRLSQAVLPNEHWQTVAQPLQGATSLAAAPNGDVYLSDAAAATVYKIGADGKPAKFAANLPALEGMCFGPDGTLYGCDAGKKRIVAIDPSGAVRTVAHGIAGHGITVSHDGTLYVSEPGEHAELPSTIWRITPAGVKTALDHGLFPATGVAFQPDGALFYAAESSSRWVYSYIVQPDGSFADRMPFYWLHVSDDPSNAGAEDLANDKAGFLYVATRMGIQICDLRGEVGAIVPLPTPCGPVRSLCFGGPNFDELYATDGTQLFKRKMKAQGVAPWMPPVTLPTPGGP